MQFVNIFLNFHNTNVATQNHASHCNVHTACLYIGRGKKWQRFQKPLLCYVKLCASFQSHPWNQNGLTVRKPSIRVKIGDFLSLEICQMTLNNNRASLLCHFKLCAWFRSHWRIWIGVSVPKRQIDDFLAKWPSNIKHCALFRHHTWIHIWVKSR